MKNLLVVCSFILFCSCSSGVKLSFKNNSGEFFKKITAQIGKANMILKMLQVDR
jgi:hypothetical protein